MRSAGRSFPTAELRYSVAFFTHNLVEIDIETTTFGHQLQKVESCLFCKLGDGHFKKPLQKQLFHQFGVVYGSLFLALALV